MDVLALLYSFSGLVFGAAFIPQVVTLLKDTSGAASFNISTWSIFTLCNLVTLLYAVTHTGDHYFVFCSAIGVIGNLSVLTLGAVRRLHPAKVTARAVVKQDFFI